MKKIFTMAFIALTLLATACGKSNDDNPQEEAKKALIGTWKIESVTINGISEVLSNCDRKSYIVFSEREKVNYLYSDRRCDTPQEIKATYSVLENVIRTVTKNETSDEKFSISENRLTLSHTEENNGEKMDFVFIYTKQ